MTSQESTPPMPADVHLQTFESFAHRVATTIESRVLGYALQPHAECVASSSPSQGSLAFPDGKKQLQGEGRASSSRGPRPALWVHGLRPEAIAYLAATLSHQGLSKRILFLSNDRRQLEERHMRFASRAKVSLFDPSSKVVRPADPGGHLLYCAIDHIDEARLSRIWGAAGPDIIIVENAHIFSPYCHEYRAKAKALKRLQSRWPTARLILESTRLSADERQECEERLGVQLAQPALYEQLGNLRLEVLHAPHQQVGAGVGTAQADTLETLAETLPRPSLFLAQSPQQVDQIYARLAEAQVPVHRLHAAMSESERGRELLQFTLPGRRAVMVSTMRTASSSTEERRADLLQNQQVGHLSEKPGPQALLTSGLLSGQEVSAVPNQFGRGYARADIRSIVHLNAPQSLAQYTRDLSLLAARCISNQSTPKDEEEEYEEPRALIIADPQDLIAAHEQLGARGPAAELLEASLPHLVEKGPQTPLPALAMQLGVSTKRLSLVLAHLADTGAFKPRKETWNPKTDGETLMLLGQQLVDELIIHRSADALRLAKVEKYWEAEGCRRQALLAFFGEEEKPCGVCDHCADRKAPAQPPRREKGSSRRRQAS